MSAARFDTEEGNRRWSVGSIGLGVGTNKWVGNIGMEEECSRIQGEGGRYRGIGIGVNGVR